MQTLEVNAPNGRYAIWAKRGLLQDMEAFLPLLEGGAAAIITDDTVRGLYGERLRAALEAAGVRCMLFSFPAGEESKNHATLCAAYGALMEQGMTRKDTIIAPLSKSLRRCWLRWTPRWAVRSRWIFRPARIWWALFTSRAAS